jgi:4-diphosphocytidyl-2-C-methyl-D-erythritol kinase
MVMERACAKINLALHVLGRRNDGYHELDSVVVFADIADVLQVQLGDDFSLHIDGPFAEAVPTGSENIIFKAWNVLGQVLLRRGIIIPPMEAKLTKNLPVASGMGGGSADAAAFLRAVLRLTNSNIYHDEVIGLAETLGADVPVCFWQKPCRMLGIGEIIRELTIELPRAMVLINPGQACGTSAVFSQLNLAAGEKHKGELDMQNDGLWRNDLTAAAITVLPLVGDVLAALQQEPCLTAARMSGSGATCFGLAKTMAEASAAAARLSVKNPNWWVKAAQVI